MPSYEFTAVLDRAPTDAEFDRLFEAGLDDALPVVEAGNGYLYATRNAPTLIEAIFSVAHDAAEAGFSVVRLEDHDLVSLKTVARRAGRSYESVRLLAQGKRGPGGFPAPLSDDSWALYSWTKVAEWFRASLAVDMTSTEDERVIAAASLVLRARSLVGGRGLADMSTLAQKISA
ncbi:hypothetical protein [Subtercola lobariae]|uniref:DNA-binding protein n=1 Tax=Subtercola lobariae TaxID=1588641 RepID=A0A917EV11_9MICO|nr:hypothetical protein [Subtercola lobariae]GGF16064.1 hypothetical protein GCM10011399_07350 [Subtercola lobariae]